MRPRNEQSFERVELPGDEPADGIDAGNRSERPSLAGAPEYLKKSLRLEVPSIGLSANGEDPSQGLLEGAQPGGGGDPLSNPANAGKPIDPLDAIGDAAAAQLKALKEVQKKLEEMEKKAGSDASGRRGRP